MSHADPRTAAPTTDAAPRHAARAAAPTGRDRLAHLIAAGGGVVVLASGLLAWSYSREPLGNLTWYANPGGVQIMAMVMAVIAIALVARRFAGRPLDWLDSTPALRAIGTGAAIFMVTVVVIISVESGGLVNLEPGAWIGLVGTAAMAVGGWLAEPAVHDDALHAAYSSTAEIIVIILLLAGVLFLGAYGLGLEDGGQFVTLLLCLGAIGFALTRAGFFQWLGMASIRHGNVLRLGAVAVAFLFPLTQDGSDANMSIATQVLIFATTALGLNIVVGLAGLLDLGYIAFLGAGAYVGALLSGAASSVIGWQPPFLVTMLIGGLFAALLGLIIGSPTLRVSGDYLAIVTLAFGEIFRITVNNLDGTTGPNLTNGPNGVFGIPPLVLFGFDFSETREIPGLGIPITPFANYYFVLLIISVLVIVIFSRLNNSRIGRGWVAIREDERAAEAMGVNTFGLKLFAFAGGAFLAGVAGTVKAHYDVSVSPEQYIFLESAFLLAAVVLGGMGTVAGVLVGATILKLLPEKLRFLDDYRLLIFGVLLVIMMRFRPEGLIPSRRRQLEFHESDDELAEQVGDANVEIGQAKA